MAMNKKIEAGDLVRVVKMDEEHVEYIPDLDKFLGHFGIAVGVGDSDNCWGVHFSDEDEWWYFHESWLEIIESNELGEVMEDEEKLRERKDSCYEALRRFVTSPEDDDAGTYLADEIRTIFNED